MRKVESAERLERRKWKIMLDNDKNKSDNLTNERTNERTNDTESPLFF